ncbi:PREDICTED: agamous-like MADS-box protein AGL62 [Camelina sativa]|uniref:Agamous-like MADS-box protein AGL62 n=1 Tax=Camelina sativa TaxID=90675 RepID=A0ABM1RBQ8_CAMSA|nr:PREDICTED: agamous-like MADS-box protein AGL62 [Camelina sativa]
MPVRNCNTSLTGIKSVKSAFFSKFCELLLRRSFHGESGLTAAGTFARMRKSGTAAVDSGAVAEISELGFTVPVMVVPSEAMRMGAEDFVLAKSVGVLDNVVAEEAGEPPAATGVTGRELFSEELLLELGDPVGISRGGRQKIEMKKIKNESNLQVTFSKRRFGLFKKASELCTLCGAEILMIVFSPGGKAFSFGHPSVRELIHRFLNVNHNSLIPHQTNYNLQLVESRPDRNIQYLNEMLTQVLARQKKAKHNRMTLDMVRQSREERGKSWYEKDVKELDLNETDNLICALQDVKKTFVSEMSDYPQLNVSHQSYMGESFVFGGGRNVDEI